MKKLFLAFTFFILGCTGNPSEEVLKYKNERISELENDRVQLLKIILAHNVDTCYLEDPKTVKLSSDGERLSVYVLSEIVLDNNTIRYWLRTDTISYNRHYSWFGHIKSNVNKLIKCEHLPTRR